MEEEKEGGGRGGKRSQGFGSKFLWHWVGEDLGGRKKKKKARLLECRLSGKGRKKKKKKNDKGGGKKRKINLPALSLTRQRTGGGKGNETKAFGKKGGEGRGLNSVFFI